MTDTSAPRTTHSVVRAGTSLIALALPSGFVSLAVRTAAVVGRPVSNVARGYPVTQTHILNGGFA